MATTNLNEPTSSADGNIPYVGSAADDGTGNTLREAISRINARLRELYGSQDASNNVQTPFVDNDNIKDGAVSESKLSISNSPANGQILSWDDSANQFVWKNEFDGDITSIVAGSGLTGTSLDTDDATLNIGAGDGITVNADDIALASSVAGSGLSYSSGVLSVDEIDTGGIASDAVTAPKIDFFYDSTNGSTAGNILVADGTKFINRTVIGDVTINSSGSTSIGSGKVLSSNIAYNQVTHNHLEGRYTAIQTNATTSGTGASAIDVSCDAATILYQSAAITAAIEYKLDDYKIGQVLDIYGLTGDFAITITSTGTGTTTVNNVGGGEYDGSAYNHIQIVCLAEGNDPVFNYTTATYTSDNSPNA